MVRGSGKASLVLANLATQSDATAYGYGTISNAFFARASARVRGYVRQRITAGTSTIVARGPVILLPERPVASVTLVKDENGDTILPEKYTLRQGGVLEVPEYGENLTITYSHGFTALPDELVEVVCNVASRLSQINPAAAAGVIQETGGSESVSFGFDSYNAISDLTTGEKMVLDRLFPKRAGLVVQRP
jgi:hypothetical protein